MDNANCTAEEAATISLCAHEKDMDKMETVVKRLWIVILVIFAAFVVTNAYWIYRENQYKDEEYTYEFQQDSGEGGQNTYTNNRIILGGDFYGEAESQGDGEAPGAQNVD